MGHERGYEPQCIVFLWDFWPLSGDLGSIRGVLALGMGREALHIVKEVNKSTLP